MAGQTRYTKGPQTRQTRWLASAEFRRQHRGRDCQRRRASSRRRHCAGTKSAGCPLRYQTCLPQCRPQSSHRCRLESLSALDPLGRVGREERWRSAMANSALATAASTDATYGDELRIEDLAGHSGFNPTKNSKANVKVKCGRLEPALMQDRGWALGRCPWKSESSSPNCRPSCCAGNRALNQHISDRS